MCLKWMSNNYLSLHLQVISQVFFSAIKILGNMSKYQSINWVAIFSDSLFDWYQIEWNGISLCQQKQSMHEWLSFQCINRLGKTNCLQPCCICLSKMCMFPQKIGDKCVQQRFVMDDNNWGNTKNFCIKLFHNETVNYSSMLKKVHL